MDYVVGNVAALLSGNVTPNRPKLTKRALTPIKHMPSPNVTPKSEFVDDRSIFLSPTTQKKKAIVKKSPKRIFQNPDLDVTAENEGNSSVTSPKADKVKKHLKKDLEADTSLDKSVEVAKTLKVKSGKSTTSPSPQKNIENNDLNSSGKENVNANELTPKKKKKQQKNVENTSQSPAVAVDANESAGTPTKKKKQKKDSVTEIPHGDTQSNEVTLDSSTSVGASPKKNKKNRNNSLTTELEKPNKTTNVIENSSNATASPKKKNKRRNKSKNKQPQVKAEGENNSPTTPVTKQSTDKVVTENTTSDTVNPKKKNKRRNKSKNKQLQQKTVEINGPKATDTIEKSADSGTEKNAKETTSPSKKKNRKRKKTVSEQPQPQQEVEDEIGNNEEDGESSPKKSKKKIKINPNAITDKDTDSEHESDNEIESETEETNKELFEKSAEVDDESSDEEETPKTKKNQKEEKPETEKPKEVNTAEEIKRTLFVGNVPFSKKCKKEIKKIFTKYGEIESVRIRTVPVKDPSVTPKLAVIKQELHPERSTVNVYVKFNDPRCVEAALAENNTILNNNHLRVTRSGSTGAEHDPHSSVFVGNVPFGLEDEGLREKFERCGEIESVRIVRDKKTNAGKGFGYVNFKSKDGVELALALTDEDLTIKNRIMRVKRCTLTTKLQANKKGGKFQGPSNRQSPQNRQGPPNRQGPNNRQFSQNRQGPPNRQGPNNRQFSQNRQGPPNRQGPNNRQFSQNRQGPPNRQGPNNRQFSQNRQGPPNRQGPQNRQGFQGKKPSQGDRQRGFQNQGNQGGKFGGKGFGRQESEGQKDGAYRRVMNKRKSQEGGDGPPSKVSRDGEQAPREKKARKEFVGVTAEKKKKHKFDKGQKKKKALSEILTK